jgi:hypothetical protein
MLARIPAGCKRLTPFRRLLPVGANAQAGGSLRDPPQAQPGNVWSGDRLDQAHYLWNASLKFLEPGHIKFVHNNQRAKETACAGHITAT